MEAMRRRKISLSLSLLTLRPTIYIYIYLVVVGKMFRSWKSVREAVVLLNHKVVKGVPKRIRKLQSSCIISC